MKIAMYNLYFAMYNVIHRPRPVPARLSGHTAHTAHTLIQRIQPYSSYIIHRHTPSLCVPARSSSIVLGRRGSCQYDPIVPARHGSCQDDPSCQHDADRARTIPSCWHVPVVLAHSRASKMRIVLAQKIVPARSHRADSFPGLW